MKKLLFIAVSCLISSLSYSQDNWEVSYGIDQDTGLSITDARLIDIDTTALLYIGQKRGTLVIGLINQLVFDLDKANTIKVSFDGQDPVYYEFEASPSANPTTMQLKDKLAFRNKLSAADHVRIEATSKDQGELVFNFNTKGFNLIRFTE